MEFFGISLENWGIITAFIFSSISLWISLQQQSRNKPKIVIEFDRNIPDRENNKTILKSYFRVKNTSGLSTTVEQFTILVNDKLLIDHIDVFTTSIIDGQPMLSALMTVPFNLEPDSTISLGIEALIPFNDTTTKINSFVIKIKHTYGEVSKEHKFE